MSEPFRDRTPPRREARDGISLEEFKARLPIAEIVGRHVRLTKRGRDLWGCCPFHSEKTASFHVVVDKGYYHCFGCQEHGNAIDFTMAVERLEFREALERLSEITGIPAPLAGSAAQPKIDSSLYEVNAKAARWFNEQLSSPQGKAAREYLEERGLDRTVLDRFGIGYAPQARDGLERALKAQGIAQSQLLEVGLIARSEKNGELYDRFRHRIIFPIADEQGRIRGFGGRALSAEAMAKYLNTAETPLFKKGQLLYGLDRAARAARQNRALIVAEGYLDVIALMRAGLEHSVAPLGTAVTEEQLQRLWRYADTPLFCLDGDAAGLRAAARAAVRALPLLKPGRSLAFALLPEGEDPDSLFKKQGAAALRSKLEASLPLVELLWRHESAQLTGRTPEARALLEQRLQDLANSITDRTVQYQYRTEFRERLRQFWRQERTAPRRDPSGRGHAARSFRPGGLVEQSRGEGSPTSRTALASGVEDPDWRRESALLAQILINPWLLRHVGDKLCMLELRNEALDALRQELIEWASHHSDLDAQPLRTHLVRYGFAATLERVAAVEKVLRPVDEGDREFVAAWFEAATMFEGRGRYRRGIQELEQRLATSGSDGTTAYLHDLSRYSNDLLSWDEIEERAESERSQEPNSEPR